MNFTLICVVSEILCNQKSYCAMLKTILIFKLFGSGINNRYFITPCKRSCGKVMFLHLSVIMFTGGWGSLSKGGSLSGGVLCLGGLCQGDPPYDKERVVLILPECFLVFSKIEYHLSLSLIKYDKKNL